MTLEDLIRDGLDVEQIPPGTAVILHARHPIPPDLMMSIADRIDAVSDRLGVKIAVVSYDFDVLFTEAAAVGRHIADDEPATPTGVPLGREVHR